jgi:hypothetical protein
MDICKLKIFDFKFYFSETLSMIFTVMLIFVWIDRICHYKIRVVNKFDWDQLNISNVLKNNISHHPASGLRVIFEREELLLVAGSDLFISTFPH